MNTGSHYSNVTVRASLRAGSKARPRWLLVPLLPVLIQMAASASVAAVAYRSETGVRKCEGFGELTKEDFTYRAIANIAKDKRTPQQNDYRYCLAVHGKKDADWAPKP